MPEYIERDYAVYLVEHFGSMLTWSKEDILSEIKRKLKEQPTADVVEVVRCKNCIHFSNDTDYCKEHNKGYCEFDNVIKPQTYFCSYGERKEVDNGHP